MPFRSLKLHPSLLAGIKDLGFSQPTPIQADAIPPALLGRDVLACAMTGSGKTAAFVLPIVHKLLAKPRGTTRALIIRAGLKAGFGMSNKTAFYFIEFMTALTTSLVFSLVGGVARTWFA